MATSDPHRPGDGASPDDAWADIVANFGERAVLEPESAPAPAPPTPEPVVSHVFGDDVDEEPDWEDDDILLPGSFVAPEPEPIGWHGWRSMAWVGVLGAPALALLWTLVVNLTDWRAPDLFGYALVGIFLGSFGYLVATMPKEKDDPWDDGARV